MFEKRKKKKKVRQGGGGEKIFYGVQISHILLSVKQENANKIIYACFNASIHLKTPIYLINKIITRSVNIFIF